MTTNRDYALKAHSKKLEEAVVRYAHVTAYSCHEHFLDRTLEHGSKEHDVFYSAFQELWDDLVAEGRRSPDEQNTISLRLFYAGGRNLPSTFRDHLDFLADLVAMVVRRTFRFVLDIAGEDGVAWAMEQALRLVRDIDWPEVVAAWVRAACVGEGGGAEPWLIPAFLRMKPAGPDPYVAERAWRSLDADSTGAALNCFVVEIVGKLEGCIEEAAGEAYQKAATLEASHGREPMLIEAIPSTETVEEPKDKGPAAEGAAAKENKRTFNLQVLINRWEKDKKGATYDYPEAAFLLGYHDRKVIGRMVKNEILKQRPHSRRVFADPVIQLRNTKSAETEPPQ